ncbi:MAG TPA: hypothetical protein VG319_09710 [Polyangia bacterium]|jgi:hypothetical protein|nr:hypothetical protein [Polyangia bacterium]
MREPRSTLILVATLLPVLAIASGCGKLKPQDTTGAAGSTGTGGAAGAEPTGAAGSNGTVQVSISGTAAPHPLNKALLMEDEDFSMLKVAIVDPAAVLLNPDATPLGSMALDTSAANCDPSTGCKWTLAGVDITNLTLGLVGTLEDTRTGAARVWVKTGTGMGTAADLAAVRAAPMPIVDRRAFAVSRKLEAALGQFVGQVLKITLAPGDLEARGFLIGHVVGKLSEGPMPAGVAGAMVSATGNFDVIYPNATFSGAGTTTAASGIFLMVPRPTDAGAFGPVVTMWDVVPPTNDTRTWASHLAGSNPSNAFVIIMPANE